MCHGKEITFDSGHLVGGSQLREQQPLFILPHIEAHAADPLFRAGSEQKRK